MPNISRTFQVISFVLCCLCLAAAIWMASVLHDALSWGMVVMLALASVWTGINAFHKHTENP